MDENNDEFCQYPTIKGKPLSHQGHVTATLKPQNKFIMSEQSLKQNLKVLSTTSTSRNPYNQSSFAPIPQSAPTVTPPQAPKVERELKPSKSNDEQIMLLMMKTSGMIES